MKCPHKGCSVEIDDIDEFVLHVATHKETPVESPEPEPKKRFFGLGKKKAEVKTMPDKKNEEPVIEEPEALAPEPQETPEMRLDYLEQEVEAIGKEQCKMGEKLCEIATLLKTNLDEAFDEDPAEIEDTQITIVVAKDKLPDILHSLQLDNEIEVVIR